jgi:hypothetical protein
MAEDTLKREADGAGLEARVYEQLEKEFQEVSRDAFAAESAVVHSFMAQVPIPQP